MQNRSLYIVFLLVACTLSIPQLYAQQDYNRIALLIGNADYGDTDSNLSNPINDIDSMKQTLTALGFDVIRCADCNKRQMVESIQLFENSLRKRITRPHYFTTLDMGLG